MAGLAYSGAMTRPAQTVSGAFAPVADARAFRDALARFPTGVTVITALDASRRTIGLTANSFASLSLEPPLIVWSLRASSASLPALLTGSHFAVNVLAEGQVEVSRRFAAQAPDRFAATPHATNEQGVPLLHGAAAWLECRTLSHQTAGDHVLFIGEVLRFAATEQAPLLFHGGGYHMLGERL